ncbi:MAG: LysR family transcriptional regulator, partial [Pseudomonadota bacterium]
MLLRHLQYLVALAQERHFARAASACAVTQPTLSSGIKQLEEEMGVLLVFRGQRFEGFTPEGERVLDWAQRIIAECEGLKQEAAKLRGELQGSLRLGAVPTSIPMLPILLNAYAEAHPAVRLSLRSRSSAQILGGLEDHTLDAGVTYLGSPASPSVREFALFMERYVLLVARRHAPVDATSLPWSEVPALRYCLLAPQMQNRRIIDETLASVGQQLEPVLEADSASALLPLINTGEWASIVPRSLLAALPVDGEVVALDLVEPTVERAIGLVVPARDP